MGTEEVQGAMGKPPGRARRCETFCVCKEVRDNLQTYEAKTFVMALRLPEGRLFSIFKEEQPKNRPCAKDFHGKREILACIFCESNV